MNVNDRQNVSKSYFSRLKANAQPQPKAETKTAVSVPTESFQTTAAEPALMQKTGAAPTGQETTSLLKTGAKTAFQAVGGAFGGFLALLGGAAKMGAAVGSALKDVATGATRNSHFEQKVDAGSDDAAAQQFEEAKGRLLNPNEWKKLGPSFGAASFQVYGQDTAEPVDGAPKKGDYLKIGLPDPFPYVWVQIDKIETGDKHAEVVVRPAADPTGSSNAPVHLFSDETTNVFRVSREGSELTSSVSGMNEKLNTGGGFFSRTIAAARLAGAWSGAKKPQWNAFTKKILGDQAPAKALQSSGLETALRVSSETMRSGKETK
jgi:hypothetical protein